MNRRQLMLRAATLIGADAKGIVAQQTIHHDGERASYLALPMTKSRAAI